MPELIPTKKFLKDLEKFRTKPILRKKIAKTLVYLESDPLHPGLRIERIVNDPSAWSARIDRKYRISVEPQRHFSSGNPDWQAPAILLRILATIFTSSHGDRSKLAAPAFLRVRAMPPVTFQNSHEPLNGMDGCT